MFDFHVVPGTVVADILSRSRKRVLDVVGDTYLAHEQGKTINPDSYFLRFPDKPNSRVIALPGYLGGAVDKIGIKWIGSFPDNVSDGLPRASAVLVLNDYQTGYPLACLEAGGISAARTAASAALAATVLGALAEEGRARHVAFVGAGVIARTILDYLVAAGVNIASLRCFDLDPTSARNLLSHARATTTAGSITPADTLAEALTAELVVFATTAGEPYVPADTAVRPGQLLLNVSLRDLPPQLLLKANNVVDDVEHCLKANTSPHLAEQLTGSREFITATIGSLLDNPTPDGAHPPNTLDPLRPTIFSPFGLGVLDIAVGHLVLEEARRLGGAVPIPGFFGETSRW